MSEKKVKVFKEQPVGVEDQMLLEGEPFSPEQARAIVTNMAHTLGPYLDRMYEDAKAGDEAFASEQERDDKFRADLEVEYQQELDKSITEIASNLAKFFYILMRDELTVGRVHKIIKSQIGKGPGMYSDDILRVKAESLAIMVIRDEYQVTEIEAAIHLPGSE